jgi:branched-chain amino acid transport system ATP-binding protein
MNAEALLAVDDLVAGYGKIEVLHGISLSVREGTLCAIVGANGAGKTTLLSAISAILATRGGRITFAGRDITHDKPHRIVRAGIAHVPEGRRMLPYMTVEDNLLVASSIRRDGGVPADLDALYARFPILRERRAVFAGSLSGGEQQMLAIARALIGRPRLLLLDEPSMGLAPKLVEAIFGIIAEERARGTSILLVEQNARKALAIADYAYVLDRGRITLEGPGVDLLADENVTAAYLGG